MLCQADALHVQGVGNLRLPGGVLYAAFQRQALKVSLKHVRSKDDFTKTGDGNGDLQPSSTQFMGQFNLGTHAAGRLLSRLSGKSSVVVSGCRYSCPVWL